MSTKTREGSMRTSDGKSIRFKMQYDSDLLDDVQSRKLLEYFQSSPQEFEGLPLRVSQRWKFGYTGDYMTLKRLSDTILQVSK